MHKEEAAHFQDNSSACDDEVLLAAQHCKLFSDEVYCAEEPFTEEEEAISTTPEAMMEYTVQLLAIMQDKAEARGGVAVLGKFSPPPPPPPPSPTHPVMQDKAEAREHCSLG